MKTKLTLLLALASSVSLQAEKPNFNGARPAAQAPAPRSSPSYSGGHSSRSASVGQIIGIARSVLPLVMNAAPQQPRQAPPPPRPLPAKKSSAPVVNTKKPASRINANVTKPSPLSRTTPSGSHNTVSNAPAGIDSKLAADLKAGREIASGLQSLDSLRASFAAPEGFGDVFNQPGNPGRGDQGDLADPFNSDREYGSTPALPSGIDPSRRRGGSATGLRDIRGDMGKSRRLATKIPMEAGTSAMAS